MITGRLGAQLGHRGTTRPASPAKNTLRHDREVTRRRDRRNRSGPGRSKGPRPATHDIGVTSTPPTVLDPCSLQRAGRALAARRPRRRRTSAIRLRSSSTSKSARLRVAVATTSSACGTGPASRGWYTSTIQLTAVGCGRAATVTEVTEPAGERPSDVLDGELARGLRGRRHRHGVTITPLTASEPAYEGKLASAAGTWASRTTVGTDIALRTHIPGATRCQARKPRDFRGSVGVLLGVAALTTTCSSSPIDVAPPTIRRPPGGGAHANDQPGRPRTATGRATGGRVVRPHDLFAGGLHPNTDPRAPRPR